MKKFAVLNFDGEVVNVLVASSLSVAEEVSSSTCREISSGTIVSIGYTWDGTRFIPSQPYPSWILNTITYEWEAPVAMPSDGKPYEWNEETTAWVEIPLS